MSFSCAELERYYDAQVALRGKYEGLAAAYSGKHFENMEARAFARQGFPRRLELMQHCIESSMEAFPPRISWAPGPFRSSRSSSMRSAKTRRRISFSFR